MIRGTMADIAGTTATTLGITAAITAGSMILGITTVGMVDITEASTTLGTIVPGIRDFMTPTITTCIHITADGTEDGVLTTEASTTDHHTQEDIFRSAAAKSIEALVERPSGAEPLQA